MATRLDDPVVALDPTLDARSSGSLVPHRSQLPHIDPDTPVEVPTGGLMRAMAMWLSGVYALCWIGLPLLAVLTLGTSTRLLASGILGAPVFALASLVTMVAAAFTRPRMTLSLRSARDPVLSAAAGGLLTLGLIHNISPFLVPFASMGPTELAVLLGINVVEMTLLGMMLASFTRRRSTAFALGATYQWLTGGIFTVLLAL